MLGAGGLWEEVGGDGDVDNKINVSIYLTMLWIEFIHTKSFHVFMWMFSCICFFLHHQIDYANFTFDKLLNDKCYLNDHFFLA